MTKSFSPIIIVAAVAAAVALLLATAAHADTVSPGWVASHTSDAFDFLGTAGPTLTGEQSGTFSYVLGSTFDLSLGNTSICIWNGMQNQSLCDEYILILPSTDYTVKIFPANYVDGFFFETTGTSTADLTTTSYRWSGHYGMEWSINRGILAGAKSGSTTQVQDFYTNVVVWVQSSTTGDKDIIVANANVNHQQKFIWSLAIPIPTSSVAANTAHSRDFVWLYEKAPTVAFLTLGAVTAVNTDTGVVTKTNSAPCGYDRSNFTDANMKAVRVGGKHVLILYGNVKGAGAGGSDAFVICGLNMSAIVDTEFKFVFPEGTVTIANRDFSLNVIHTYYERMNTYFNMETLFLSGSVDNNAPGDKIRLWAYDLKMQTRLWAKTRSLNDELSMPIPIYNSTDEHVAVTINGTLMGIDPSNNIVRWQCPKNVGCRGTPAVQRTPVSNAIHRLVCVSSVNEQQVIAVDIGKTDQDACVVVWQKTLTSTTDVSVQNVPGAMLVTNWPLEPFVTIPDNNGKIETMSFRASNEPAPVPPPPAPTPKPAPPQHYNVPEDKVVLQPPTMFEELELRHMPAISAFKAEGPMVAVVGAAIMPPKTVSSSENPKMREAIPSPAEKAKMAAHRAGLSLHDAAQKKFGIGNSKTVLYYESAELDSIRMPFVGAYTMLPSNIYLSLPVPFASSAAGYAVAAYETNLEFDMIMLYTTADKNVGHYETVGRYGCSTGIAADINNAMLFYSTGNHKSEETFYAVKQAGTGAATSVPWAFKVTAPAKLTENMCGSGDLLFVTSKAGKGLLAFSAADTLYVVDTADGTQVAKVTDPAGFKPSPTTHSFLPMELSGVAGSTKNLIVGVIDTYKTVGTETRGVFAMDTADYSIAHSFQLNNVSYVLGVVSLPAANMYAMDLFDNIYTGYLMGVDIATGAQTFKVKRDNAVGSEIWSVPNSKILYTNMDDAKTYMAFAAVNGVNGKVLGQCEFACAEFTMVQDSAGNSIVLCSVFEAETLVRAIMFDKSFKCVVAWEVDAGADVQGISAETFKVGMRSFATLVTNNGYMISVTPDAFVEPTLAPVGPDQFPKPVSDATTALGAQWQTPVVVVPGVADPTSGVSFVAVDAGVALKSVEKNNKYVAGRAPPHIKIAPSSDEEIAEEEENNSNVGGDVRVTALVGYSTATTTSGATSGNFTFPAYTTLDQPNIFLRAPHFTAAYFATTGNALTASLSVIAVPGAKHFVDRFGATARPVTDNKGTVFFTAGAYKNEEFLFAYTLSSDDSSQFTTLWSSPASLKPAAGFTVANMSAHTGDPIYIPSFSGDSKSYVALSYFDTLYVFDTLTGAQVSATKNPCGFVSPQDPYNQGAPWPMQLAAVGWQGGDSRIVAFINSAVSEAEGTWGVCVLDRTGATVQWKTTVADVDNFRSLKAVSPGTFSNDEQTTYFLLDIVSDKNGGGQLHGFNLKSGHAWAKTRRFASGKSTMGIGARNFIGNMDNTANTAMAFALVTTDSGAIVAQADFACLDKTIVYAGSGVIGTYGYPLFVCARLENSKVLRAFYFDMLNNKALTIYWEVVAADFVDSVSLSSDGTKVAVQMANGATSTVAVSNGATLSPGAHTPSPGGPHTTLSPPKFSTRAPGAPTPVPPGETTLAPTAAPGSGSGTDTGSNGGGGGVSGGAVAAIVICVILVLAAGGVTFWVLRRRGMRRSAMAPEGMRVAVEYGHADQPDATEDSGYGSIS